MVSWTGVLNNCEVVYEHSQINKQNGYTNNAWSVHFNEGGKTVISICHERTLKNTDSTKKMVDEDKWKEKLCPIIKQFLKGGLANIQNLSHSNLLYWTTVADYKIEIHYTDFILCCELSARHHKQYRGQSYYCWYIQTICEKDNGYYAITIYEPQNRFNNNVFGGKANSINLQSIITHYANCPFEIQFQPKNDNSYQNVVNYNGANNNYEIDYVNTNSVLDIDKTTYENNKMNRVSYLALINFFNGDSDYPKTSKAVDGLILKNFSVGISQGTIHIPINGVNANGEVI